MSWFTSIEDFFKMEFAKLHARIAALEGQSNVLVAPAPVPTELQPHADVVAAVPVISSPVAPISSPAVPGWDGTDYAGIAERTAAWIAAGRPLVGVHGFDVDVTGAEVDPGQVRFSPAPMLAKEAL